MQTTYCFHLGRNHELSLAELRTFLGENIESQGEIAVINMDHLEEPRKFLDQLGGTMKISEKIEKSIPEMLLQIKPEGKIKFGLNLFPADNRKLLKKLKNIKDILKNQKRNPRFINKKENLTTAMIIKGGLTKEGTDFNLVEFKGETLTTRTVAVQNFAAYSLRDYEKPARLAKEGMLPPKLAQIMINLSGRNSGTLYDPFCGSGTVLGEALIKGMNAIGSDLDPKAIEAAQKNTTWLQKQFKTTGDFHLFQKDAQEIIVTDLPQTPDMIVSETHLGPPCNPKMTEGQIKQIQKELLPLYKNTFHNLRPLLKPKTPLVIAFPLHHVNRSPLPLPGLKEILKTAGYKIHDELIYHRQKQIVGRQIIVFES